MKPSASRHRSSKPQTYVEIRSWFRGSSQFDWSITHSWTFLHGWFRCLANASQKCLTTELESFLRLPMPASMQRRPCLGSSDQPGLGGFCELCMIFLLDALVFLFGDCNPRTISTWWCTHPRPCMVWVGARLPQKQHFNLTRDRLVPTSKVMVSLLMLPQLAHYFLDSQLQVRGRTCLNRLLCHFEPLEIARLLDIGMKRIWSLQLLRLLFALRMPSFGRWAHKTRGSRMPS